MNRDEGRFLNEDDEKRKVNAEIALRHVRDQQRLIDAMGPEIHKQMEPLKERRQRNHFKHEYEELYGGS